MLTIVPVERAGTGPGGESSDPFPHEGGETHALIRVDNISHILSAYGAVAAHAAIARLDLVLDQLRAMACLVQERRPGLVEISFGHRSSADAMAIVEALLDGLSIEPVKAEGLSFHMALSCAVGVGERARALPSYSAAGDDEVWSERYRKTMRLAGEALAALREGRLHMSWQPIRSATVPAHVLYSEGLARIADSDGEFLAPSLFVPALEILGLAPVFDRRVVASVLTELEQSPDAILGVNISGQSARLDAWWRSLFERLRQAPDVARRLVIEITETAALASDACDFVAELHRLGCCVALDDFGVGHASVRNAMAVSPDIIKIDSFFLQRGDVAFLEYLIGLAGAVAPIVIVEGVEAEEQSRMAAALQKRLTSQANCWQQGHHFGHASTWRSWRYREDGGEAVRTVSLRELAGLSHDFRPGSGPAGLGRA